MKKGNTGNNVMEKIMVYAVYVTGIEEITT